MDNLKKYENFQNYYLEESPLDETEKAGEMSLQTLQDLINKLNQIMTLDIKENEMEKTIKEVASVLLDYLNSVERTRKFNQ